jgi:hypothetical protein
MSGERYHERLKHIARIIYTVLLGRTSVEEKKLGYLLAMEVSFLRAIQTSRHALQKMRGKSRVVYDERFVGK